MTSRYQSADDIIIARAQASARVACGLFVVRNAIRHRVNSGLAINSGAGSEELRDMLLEYSKCMENGFEKMRELRDFMEDPAVSKAAKDATRNAIIHMVATQKLAVTVLHQANKQIQCSEHVKGGGGGAVVRKPPVSLRSVYIDMMEVFERRVREAQSLKDIDAIENEINVDTGGAQWATDDDRQAADAAKAKARQAWIDRRETLADLAGEITWYQVSEPIVAVGKPTVEALRGLQAKIEKVANDVNAFVSITPTIELNNIMRYFDQNEAVSVESHPPADLKLIGRVRIFAAAISKTIEDKRRVIMHNLADAFTKGPISDAVAAISISLNPEEYVETTFQPKLSEFFKIWRYLTAIAAKDAPPPVEPTFSIVDAAVGNRLIALDQEKRQAGKNAFLAMLEAITTQIGDCKRNLAATSITRDAAIEIGKQLRALRFEDNSDITIAANDPASPARDAAALTITRYSKTVIDFQPLLISPPTLYITPALTNWQNKVPLDPKLSDSAKSGEYIDAVFVPALLDHEFQKYAHGPHNPNVDAPLIWPYSGTNPLFAHNVVVRRRVVVVPQGDKAIDPPYGVWGDMKPLVYVFVLNITIPAGPHYVALIVHADPAVPPLILDSIQVGASAMEYMVVRPDSKMVPVKTITTGWQVADPASPQDAIPRANACAIYAAKMAKQYIETNGVLSTPPTNASLEEARQLIGRMFEQVIKTPIRPRAANQTPNQPNTGLMVSELTNRTKDLYLPLDAARQWIDLPVIFPEIADVEAIASIFPSEISHAWMYWHYAGPKKSKSITYGQPS